MEMNNMAILNFVYHYIYKNKQGVGNRIHLPNTNTLHLLPTPNNRGINNCSIIYLIKIVDIHKYN